MVAVPTTPEHGLTLWWSTVTTPCCSTVKVQLGTGVLVIGSKQNGTWTSAADAGDVWITQTLTSHFTFVPNVAGPPSYHGEFTFWFGESLNRNNSVVHDIGNIVVNGSDGSKITAHFVDHVSVSASGITNEFHIVSMTCP